MSAQEHVLNNPVVQQAAKNYQAHLNWTNQQQVNKRGTLQKYAPAAGATAGALLAAVLTRGASIGPTMALLGAAGAVGGGAGEVYAQKSNKEQFNVGRIGKEAAVSGATSAIPIGGFGKAAKVASQVGTSAATAGVEQAASKGITGALANSGRRLETRAGGFGIGEKIAGRAPVNTTTQRNIQQTLRAEGIKPSHAENMSMTADAKLSAYHDAMNASLTKSNRPLTAPERKTLVTDYLKKVANSPTADANVKKYAQTFAGNLTKQVKDVQGLNTFRRGIDKKAISYIANPDAATAAKTEAAQTLRQHLSDVIGKVAPEVKTVNGKYSKLSTASDYLRQQSGRLTRQSEQPGGGVVGRLLTGDVANSGKAKTGALMQKVAGVSPGVKTAPGLVRPSIGEFGKQSLAQAVLGATQSNVKDPYAKSPAVDPNTNTPNGPQDPNYVAPDPNTANANDPNAALQDPTQQAQDPNAQQQAAQTPYSLQQALADIQRDPKHTSDYLSVYKTVAAAQKDAAKAASGGAGHGIVSAQSYSNAQSGQQSLQMLGQLIQSNPSLTSKTSIPGQGAPVVGGYVQKALGTNQYKALAHNVADAVLRLRTGAQANESEIHLYMTQFMPQAGDPPQTVQRKLQILQSNFTPYLSTGGPTDLTSLTDALSAAQGGN